MMMINETFNNIKKYTEFVVLFYVSQWLEYRSQISAILNDFEFMSQLIQFSDNNNVNAVIQKI